MIHPIKHFFTITRHRHKVIALGFRCGIGFQVLFHDLSKYGPKEFFTGMKYYRGTMSPNAVERSIFGYSKAWLHHKGRNKHHFEYWTDYNPSTGAYEPVEMPIKYIKEMFCDRIAATKVYLKKSYCDSSAFEYYKNHNDQMALAPKTRDILEQWLTMLVQDGEKSTLKYIKNVK